MRLRLSVLFCFVAVCVAACASNGGNNAAAVVSPAPAVSTANVTTVSSSLFGSQGGLYPTSAAATATAEPIGTSVMTYTVQRGTVVQERELPGQVIDARQRSLAFGVDGQIKKLVVTGPGTIKKGQLLAQLDLGDLPYQLSQAQGAYAQSQLASARVADSLQTPVQRAQLDLETAQNNLAELQGPPNPTDLAKAQAAVSLAQTALAKTRNDASAVKTQAEQQLALAHQEANLAQVRYDAAMQDAKQTNKKATPDQAKQARDNVLTAQEDLEKAQSAVAAAQITYDTARGNEIAAVQDAEARLASAQADYDALMSGPTKAALAEAQQAVKLATINLAAARASAQPDPDQTQRLVSAQNEIKHIQDQIQERQLFAPFDGQIARILVEPGTQVQASTPIFIALDTSVPASDRLIQVTDTANQDASSTNPSASANPDGTTQLVSQLQIGQQVTISFDRYGEKTFPGTITGGTSTAYQVKYDAPNLAIDIGDQATVSVVATRRENTLWLPVQAVGPGSPAIVTVQKGDDTRQVTIKTGLVGKDRVEILSGLNKGDVVVGQQQS